MTPVSLLVVLLLGFGLKLHAQVRASLNVLCFTIVAIPLFRAYPGRFLEHGWETCSIPLGENDEIDLLADLRSDC